MDSSNTKLGSSLRVPSVHELAKHNLLSVPPRYIRVADTDRSPPIIITTSTSPKEIPVVDMQNLLFDDDPINPELEKLHSACKELGFFQIVNHGVNTSVVEKMKTEIETFFHLPEVEKDKFGQKADDIEGFGQIFVKSEEQKLDWGDMFYLVTQPEHLRKHYLFPKLSLSFREALEMYSTEMKSLSMNILIFMAKATRMDVQDMTSLFEEGMLSMRMNHYPPCPQPELVTGLCPHSDPVGLNIVLQVNEVNGLQVRKDGVWIPVIPLPDAFIVNVGDIIEIVTNGMYKSVEHRAIVNSERERFSIAAVVFPKLESDFGPAPSLITQALPKFKRISLVDYLKGLFSRELDGKSYLDVIRV